MEKSMKEKIVRSNLWYVLDFFIATIAAFYILNPFWSFIIGLFIVLFWINKAIDIDFKNKTKTDN